MESSSATEQALNETGKMMRSLFAWNAFINCLLLVLFLFIIVWTNIHMSGSDTWVRSKYSSLLENRIYTPEQWSALPDVQKVSYTERADHLHTIKAFKQLHHDLYVIQIASVLGLVCAIALLVVTLCSHQKMKLTLMRAEYLTRDRTQ